MPLSGVWSSARFPPGYNVISFDYPGFGENSDVDHKYWNAKSAADLARAIVTREAKSGELGDFVLSGVSFGTIVATMTANLLGSSANFKGILLDSTVARLEPPPVNPMLTESPAYKQTIRAGVPKAMLDNYLWDLPEHDLAKFPKDPLKERLACISVAAKNAAVLAR